MGYNVQGKISGSQNIIPPASLDWRQHKNWGPGQHWKAPLPGPTTGPPLSRAATNIRIYRQMESK